MIKGTDGPGLTIGVSAKPTRPDTYKLVVADRSNIHNFHLVPGVNVKTSVSFVGTKTFVVKLREGTYKYVCDPHASMMKGSFTIKWVSSAASSSCAFTRRLAASSPAGTVVFRLIQRPGPEGRRRRAADALPMEPRGQQPPLRFAVVFRVAGETPTTGVLAVEDDRLLLEHRWAEGHTELSVPYAELEEVLIGRSPEEQLNGRPALVLERKGAPPVQITSCGAGLLSELADLLATLAAEHADGREEVAVIVPLKRGQLPQLKELVAKGPPFNPAALGFTRHEVFLTADEAIFVFAGPHVRAKLERMTHNPSLWQVGHTWRGFVIGPPRLADTPPIRQEGGRDQPAYSWAATSDRNAVGPRL